MSIKTIALLGVAWGGSLLATNAWTHPQTPRWTPLTEPVVLAGNDVGFRVEWMNGRTPTGTIVVRLDGQWIDARVGEPANRRLVPPPLPPSPPPPPR